MNIFEKASRVGLRFTTSAGKLSVEDIWNLPLAAKGILDIESQKLNTKLNSGGTTSFITDNVDTDSEHELDQLRFDILRHVIDVKKAEREALKKAREVKEKRQKLMALIDQKENEALGSTSLDELRKQLASIDA